MRHIPTAVASLILFLVCATNASAGAWSLTPDPARVGFPAGSVSQAITIAFTGDGATQDAQIDYDFTEGSFTAQPAAMNGGTCAVVTIAGNQRLRVRTPTGSTLPPLPTTFCSVRFTSLSANVDTASVEFSFPTSNVICGDAVGLPTTCSAGGPMRLDVGQTFQSPLLAFSPAPGPIVVGPTGAVSIVVTAGNGDLGSTTLTCSSTSGTATVSNSPFARNSVGAIHVQCAGVAGSSTPFVVTCDPVPALGEDQAPVQFSGTCPALVLGVPLIDQYGRALMAALLAGLGLLGFALRRGTRSR